MNNMESSRSVARQVVKVSKRLHAVQVIIGTIAFSTNREDVDQARVKLSKIFRTMKDLSESSSSSSLSSSSSSSSEDNEKENSQDDRRPSEELTED